MFHNLGRCDFQYCEVAVFNHRPFTFNIISLLCRQGVRPAKEWWKEPNPRNVLSQTPVIQDQGICFRALETAVSLITSSPQELPSLFRPGDYTAEHGLVHVGTGARKAQKRAFAWILPLRPAPPLVHESSSAANST